MPDDVNNGEQGILLIVDLHVEPEESSPPSPVQEVLSTEPIHY